MLGSELIRTTVFSVRNIEKTKEGHVGRAAVALGQTKNVFDAVKEGDAVAIEIAEEFGDYLGKGLAAIAGVVNPEAFVIGGGVSRAGEILFDYIRPAYQKYVFHGSESAEMKLATLENASAPDTSINLYIIFAKNETTFCISPMW